MPNTLSEMQTFATQKHPSKSKQKYLLNGNYYVKKSILKESHTNFIAFYNFFSTKISKQNGYIAESLSFNVNIQCAFGPDHHRLE